MCSSPYRPNPYNPLNWVRLLIRICTVNWRRVPAWQEVPWAEVDLFPFLTTPPQINWGRWLARLWALLFTVGLVWAFWRGGFGYPPLRFADVLWAASYFFLPLPLFLPEEGWWWGGLLYPTITTFIKFKWIIPKDKLHEPPLRKQWRRFLQAVYRCCRWSFRLRQFRRHKICASHRWLWVHTLVISLWVPFWYWWIEHWRAGHFHSLYHQLFRWPHMTTDPDPDVTADMLVVQWVLYHTRVRYHRFGIRMHQGEMRWLEEDEWHTPDYYRRWAIRSTVYRLPVYVLIWWWSVVVRVVTLFPFTPVYFLFRLLWNMERAYLGWRSALLRGLWWLYTRLVAMLLRFGGNTFAGYFWPHIRPRLLYYRLLRKLFFSTIFRRITDGYWKFEMGEEYYDGEWLPYAEEGWWYQMKFDRRFVWRPTRIFFGWVLYRPYRLIFALLHLLLLIPLYPIYVIFFRPLFRVYGMLWRWFRAHFWTRLFAANRRYRWTERYVEHLGPASPFGEWERRLTAPFSFPHPRLVRPLQRFDRWFFLTALSAYYRRYRPAFFFMLTAVLPWVVVPALLLLLVTPLPWLWAVTDYEYVSYTSEIFLATVFFTLGCFFVPTWYRFSYWEMARWAPIGLYFVMWEKLAIRTPRRWTMYIFGPEFPCWLVYHPLTFFLKLFWIPLLWLIKLSLAIDQLFHPLLHTSWWWHLLIVWGEANWWFWLWVLYLYVGWWAEFVWNYILWPPVAPFWYHIDLWWYYQLKPFLMWFPPWFIWLAQVAYWAAWQLLVLPFWFYWYWPDLPYRYPRWFFYVLSGGRPYYPFMNPRPPWPPYWHGWTLPPLATPPFPPPPPLTWPPFSWPPF